AARDGDPRRFDLPRPMKGSAQPDFSFSGLKTAVRQAATSVAPLTGQDVADICAGFQAAVADALSDRVRRALERFKTTFPDAAAPTLVVAGGVAANQALRAALEDLCARHGFRFLAPPHVLCTDNAAMIAWAAAERITSGVDSADAMDFAPRSRWPLDEAVTPLVGFGRRGPKA
ncbi:tRNA (adenosine(37)-N6)-threonylcarbamoyltransferase complex transferase subunit TsaD, partial [Salmonella enterica subsp. enterica]|nr:tRNA (adenosine(37)-N6)-threonylcarbamoyltransferase complex transferase subunit TsaD [Salmonella enterica subsp. enterica serovar Enteritidis]